MLLAVLLCFVLVSLGQMQVPPSCDPWEVRPLDVNKDFSLSSCPTANMSISGCGDFDGDTRSLTCAKSLTLGRRCSDRRLQQWPKPEGETHVCVGNEIIYNESPPRGNGQHRPVWAKFGQYDYLPPHRWLHNLEHGAAAFLYNQCLSPEDVCLLKHYILSLRLTDKPMRWVLTPFKDLRSTMAIVTYHGTYYSDCFNEEDMNLFLTNHYRWAWEDVSETGMYDAGWQSDTLCPGDKNEETDVEAPVSAPTMDRKVSLLVGVSAVVIILVGVAAIYVARWRRAKREEKAALRMVPVADEDSEHVLALIGSDDDNASGGDATPTQRQRERAQEDAV